MTSQTQSSILMAASGRRNKLLISSVSYCDIITGTSILKGPRSDLERDSLV